MERVDKRFFTRKKKVSTFWGRMTLFQLPLYISVFHCAWLCGDYSYKQLKWILVRNWVGQAWGHCVEGPAIIRKEYLDKIDFECIGYICWSLGLSLSKNKDVKWFWRLGRLKVCVCICGRRKILQRWKGWIESSIRTILEFVVSRS